MKTKPTQYEAACRCARAQMTHAATMLEKAKDNPAEYDRWYAAALRADELSRMWIAEAERLKPAT